MQFVISLLVAAGTLIQMCCAIVDLRNAGDEAARWMGAEDALAEEHPLWRRPRIRRELRSWREPEITHGIRYIKFSLASWVMLFGAAFTSILIAPFPFV